MAELWQMSGLELGRAIAAKEVSATEALEAILERIEAVNPAINAVVTLAADEARAEAKANILTIDAKLVKRVNSHETRIDELEKEAGLPNPHKN